MMSHKSSAGADLKAFIERIEIIAAERRELADDMRLVFAEAKASGFDTKAMRRIIKARDKDPAERAEEDSLFDSYMHAIGMAVEPPLHHAVSAMGVDTASRDDVIAALQLLVPNSGEIIAKIGGKPLRIWRDLDGHAHAAEYIEPKPAPEKTGKALRSPATILTVVPKGRGPSAADIKRAADEAERRSRGRPDPGDVSSDEDETVE